MLLDILLVFVCIAVFAFCEIKIHENKDVDERWYFIWHGLSIALIPFYAYVYSLRKNEDLLPGISWLDGFTAYLLMGLLFFVLLKVVRFLPHLFGDLVDALFP